MGLNARLLPHLLAVLALVVISAITAKAQKVTLVAVGDVCMARGVDQAMTARGRGYPFEAMKRELRSTDIAFCNLECCIAECGRPVPKKYNFRARPRAAL